MEIIESNNNKIKKERKQYFKANEAIEMRAEWVMSWMRMSTQVHLKQLKETLFFFLIQEIYIIKELE